MKKKYFWRKKWQKFLQGKMKTTFILLDPCIANCRPLSIMPLSGLSGIKKNKIAQLPRIGFIWLQKYQNFNQERSKEYTFELFLNGCIYLWRSTWGIHWGQWRENARKLECVEKKMWNKACWCFLLLMMLCVVAFLSSRILLVISFPMLSKTCETVKLCHVLPWRAFSKREFYNVTPMIISHIDLIIWCD